MAFIRAALGATLLAAMTSLHAADKPCAPTDAKQAEKLIDNAITWPQMYKSFVDYVHCDTGPVGELYTESLLRLLVEWKNADALGALVQKDAKFKEFIFTHLKQPATKDDRYAIYSRATNACPKAMDAFCVELAAVVNPK